MEDEEAEIMETVRKRKPYIYTWWENCKARLAYYFCCCYRHRSWYQRLVNRRKLFDQGIDRLKREVDLIELIEMNRVLKFFI